MRPTSLAWPFLVVILLCACPRIVDPRVPSVVTEPGCEFNDDCAHLEVCAGGHCRAECRTDRDCAAGTACRPSDQRGVSACLPPDSPALCIFDSDCAAPLVCGNDGTCRAQCRADVDCGAGVQCQLPEGVCSVPAVVGEADAGPSRRDAGVLPTCDGGPCSLNADHCEEAVELVFDSDTLSVTVNPGGWTDDVGGCLAGTNDGFFRFTLDEPAVVAIVTTSQNAEHQVGWVRNDCSQVATDCSARFCDRAVVLAAELPAGEHVFVVDSAEPVTVELHRIPIAANVPAQRIVEGTATLPITLGQGSGGLCGSTGPSALAWFLACSFSAQLRVVTATTCTTAPPIDVDIALLTTNFCNGSPVQCATESAGCGVQAELQCATTDVAFGAFLVSGATPSDTGEFGLEVAWTWE